MAEDSLPSTEDLIILRSFLINKIAECLKVEIQSQKQFICLQMYILVRLILFNKRRIREVNELRVAEYNQRPNWNSLSAEQYFRGVSPSEVAMAKR